MDNITEIYNYVLFLKKECNLEITLHPMGDEQLITSGELILFNIHENARCVYVKSFPHAHEHCVERQHKVFEKCKGGSFCGTCFAGVREFVYPITDGTRQTGFICVSGYCSTDSLSYMESCSKRFDIPLEALLQTSLSLKKDIPPKEYIDTLITPLIRMLELAYSRLKSEKTQIPLIDKVIRYVNVRYTQNITLDDICTHFSCSRSGISHSFKRTTGQSFREYLTHLRLRAAKSLLCHSELGITEIAYSCGFNDSNYFSNVFKANVGMSPRMYRKNNIVES